MDCLFSLSYYSAHSLLQDCAARLLYVGKPHCIHSTTQASMQQSTSYILVSRCPLSASYCLSAFVRLAKAVVMLRAKKCFGRFSLLFQLFSKLRRVRAP